MVTSDTTGLDGRGDNICHPGRCNEIQDKHLNNHSVTSHTIYEEM